ncbi:cytochrome BD ubiquinol oxidase subunit I [Frondihabitans sp. PAMC 28766]|uniref:cytochrome ubiquinol oxidase subunit I n=1 Tax=Frondihabitans sp. PAMC 28766 TaxID=1795630 RepID=UPI00078C500F|nr:cytochrome ubiquinol oxidase subunit I [Frondihabitans sp. PAMC 28766]AMM21097.1 cytochrome BD ubiquinol oxidase subunit I [Frondihabitans sp. PAMC 28766]
MNEILSPLILSRWQFGLTTIYHFLFVPLTIGMGFTVAVFQTAWYRSGRAHYLQLTKFFGKIFLINFAMGTVTGIVQEFQFGMNWSNYSRFVGDVFGAPLALEGLLAFFLEATFIGVWIFGWDRVPKGIHLTAIWGATVGSVLSAYFIIAANSFMQNPVGYEIDKATGRAQLTDIWAVLTNKVALTATPHALFACFMVTAAVIVATAAWHLARGQHLDTMRPAMRFGLWMMVASGVLTLLSGDQLGLAMVETQPMKMASAEALYHTATGFNASFSVFSLGTPNGSSEIFSIRVPYLLSFLSTHTFTGTVEGIDNLQKQYVAAYGPGDYHPIVWITYWSFRWMMGLGMIAILISLLGLFVMRKGRMPKSKWIWRVGTWSFPLPMMAMTIGWIFTEMGRQPWLVFGLLKTSAGVSPGTTGIEVLISLILFTAIYGTLGVVEYRLIIKAAQKGPDEPTKVDEITGKLLHEATVY